MNATDLEFDEYLYVYADSAERARAFFGAPKDWPCEFDSLGPNGKLYRVKSEGLTVDMAA